MNSELVKLIAKWRQEARGCDVDGALTSIAGSYDNQERADILNRVATELENVQRRHAELLARRIDLERAQRAVIEEIQTDVDRQALAGLESTEGTKP